MPVGVVVWVAGGLGRIVGAAVVETGIGVGAKMGSAVGGAVTVGEKVRVMGNTGSSVVPGSVHISVSSSRVRIAVGVSASTVIIIPSQSSLPYEMIL